MMLMDLNQIMIANVMQNLDHKTGEIEEDLVRHMVLNSIRHLNVKFRQEYGELIIAADDTRNWRKDVFEYYKAGRKTARAKSDINWNQIFTVLNGVRDDLKMYFPYRVIQVDRAEADDVIGAIVHKEGRLLNTGEKILILSGDKDFRQLQVYGNVKQYDVVGKKWIEVDNAKNFLFEHIIRGDKGDGIPNILSDDDVFLVDGKRQKAITAKRLRELQDIDNREDNDPVKQKFLRNKKLIDLSQIESSIRNAVLVEYAKPNEKTKAHVLNYLIKHRLKLLTQSIQDF